MVPKMTEVKLRGNNINNNTEIVPGVPVQKINGVLSGYKAERKLIGIDGKWYDVTDFISKHPGGPIIEQYIGQDASAVFRSVWAHENVLKFRRPVGTYTTIQRHPADEDFEKLIELFHKKGWFETDWVWYTKKFTVILSLWIAAIVCVVGFDQWYMQYAGAVFVCLLWQQSGFLMHDFMHLQGFRDDIMKDKGLGMFFGTFVFGVSENWWHDEHMIHHAMTNTVDVANGKCDPQMLEDVWAQNEKLFPLYKGLLKYCLIKLQHITFIPFVVLIGRIGILLDSYLPERRWYEFIAIAGHWMWMGCLLSWLPTWRSVFIFYGIVALLEGILHFQLVFSHYCKMFYTVDEFHASSWYATQILSNLNIENPWWLDWFHGGLNFHIEHHLFPRLGRKHLREAGKYVREICDRHDIEYDSCGFFGALQRTLCRLKESGSHFKLDFI